MHDDQINALISDVGVEVRAGVDDSSNERIGKEFSNAAIVETCQKMINASSWGGESESKLSVVKCLVPLLSPDTGAKKSKIDQDEKE
jgi:hypothetical protein